MGMSYNSLRVLLNSHVVELAFSRRNPKQGWPRNRRMLCTTSYKLLASLGGRLAFNFKVPTGWPPYDPKSENLVIAWDILLQDFRAIPLEAVVVITAISVRNQKDIDTFWSYFDQAVRPMSSADKTKFMKS